MKCLPHNPSRLAKRGGFSLVEVTVAMAIFFMCMYALISLTIQSLNMARQLEFIEPDVGWVASELSLTNRVEDGLFENGDFGEFYPGWTWEREVILYPALEANSGPGEDIENEGLYLVNINVNDGRTVPQTHSVLMFRGEQDTGNGVSRSRTGSSRSSRSRSSASSRSSSSRNRVDPRRR